MKNYYKRALLIQIFQFLLLTKLTYGRPFQAGACRSCCNSSSTRSSIGNISSSNSIRKINRSLVSGAFINFNNRTKTPSPFKSSPRHNGCSHHRRNEFELMGINIDALFSLPFLSLPWLQKGKKYHNSSNGHTDALTQKYAPGIQQRQHRVEKKEKNWDNNCDQKIDLTMLRETFSSNDNNKVRLRNYVHQMTRNSNNPIQDETHPLNSLLFQGKGSSLQSNILQSITKTITNKNNFDLNFDPYQTFETICNTSTGTIADIDRNKKELKWNSNDLEAMQSRISPPSNSRKGLTHIVYNDKNINSKNEKDKIPDDNAINDDAEELTSTTLHTYHYPTANITLYGLNISLPKFKAWVAYTLKEHYSKNHTDSDTTTILKGSKSFTRSPTNRDNRFYYKEMSQYISTEKVEINPKRRSQLRREWFNRRLISDRTEVLTSYPSNQINDSKSDSENIDGSSDEQIDSTHQDIENKQKKQKRGGFDDLLAVYSDRLVTIVKDELSIKQSISIDKQQHSIIKGDEESTKTILDGKNLKIQNSSLDLVSWLKSEYGSNETSRLKFSNFSRMTQEDQMSTLQHFLDWFRDHFPYYYDRCDECDASFRDDQNNNSNEKLYQDKENEEEESEIIDGTFLGYVYPNLDEVEGKASRTELYHCHKCHAYTRFPRFNSISSIVKYGRGRCGEYSILAYRILRDLGHEARWVVDWSDHVWVECWLNHPEKEKGRWIHLDPCEAACDEPHLYQGWGKKQTMIIAFWVPQHKNNSTGQSHSSFQRSNIPLIQDVTQKYTSDSLEIIQSRREESNNQIQTSIQEIEARLKNKLRSLISLE